MSKSSYWRGSTLLIYLKRLSINSLATSTRKLCDTGQFLSKHGAAMWWRLRHVLLILSLVLCAAASMPQKRTTLSSVAPLGDPLRNPSIDPDPTPTPASRLRPNQARTLLTAVAGLYGLDYTLNRMLQEHLRPEVVSALKYSLSTVYFLPGFLRSSPDARTIRVGAELGVWCTIYAVSIANSISSTRASKVSFFAALGVIMPPLYDSLTHFWEARSNARSGGSGATTGITTEKERRAGGGGGGGGTVWRVAAGAVLGSPYVAPLLALAGVLLMRAEADAPTDVSNTESVIPGAAAVIGEGSLAGVLALSPALLKDLSLLVSPVASSLCYWRSERLALQAPYSALGATTVMLGTVALLTSLFSALKYRADLLPVLVHGLQGLNTVFAQLLAGPSGDGMSSLSSLLGQVWGPCLTVLVSSLLVTGWGTVTEQRALQVVSAAEAYVVLSLEPFFATFFARAVLQEAVGANTGTAALCIGAACLWRPAAAWMRQRLTQTDYAGVDTACKEKRN